MSTKKTLKLYNDSITIHFDSAARNRYIVQETGLSPVGVTTILQTLSKPGLALWPMYEALDWLKSHKEDYEGAAKAYTLKSDKGKDIGTEVHAAIEQLLVKCVEVSKGVPVTQAQLDILTEYTLLSDSARKAVKAFTQWFVDNKPKVLGTEQIIYSKDGDYAGTFDALLEIDDKVVLCDVKTTNSSRTAPLGIYPEMFLQLGGYALAHHEESGKQIDDVMIIRVGKDGVLNTLRASELGFKIDYLQDTFKHVLETYRYLTPLAKQLTERTK